MAQCFIKYQGWAEEVNEHVLIGAMSVLWRTAAEEITSTKHLSRSEIQDRIDSWGEKVKTRISGGFDIDLDGLLGGSSDNEDEFFRLISAAQSKLRAFGQYIPEEYLIDIVPLVNTPMKGTTSALLVNMLERVRYIIQRSKDSGEHLNVEGEALRGDE